MECDFFSCSGEQSSSTDLLPVIVDYGANRERQVATLLSNIRADQSHSQ